MYFRRTLSILLAAGAAAISGPAWTQQTPPSTPTYPQRATPPDVTAPNPPSHMAAPQGQGAPAAGSSSSSGGSGKAASGGSGKHKKKKTTPKPQ